MENSRESRSNAFKRTQNMSNKPPLCVPKTSNEFEAWIMQQNHHQGEMGDSY
jgi:hypothetical protein